MHKFFGPESKYNNILLLVSQWSGRVVLSPEEEQRATELLIRVAGELDPPVTPQRVREALRERSEEEQRLNLDAKTPEHARALHRVVRAMHDGHCPNCGHLAPAEHFREAGGYSCTSCQFVISDADARAALAVFHPHLAPSVKIFEAWQESREPAGST